MYEFEEFYHCGTWDTPENFFNSTLKSKNPLLIVDLDFMSATGGDPFQIIKEIRDFREVETTVVVASRSKEHAFDAIKHQCADYFLKPFHELGLRKFVLRYLRKQVSRPQKLFLQTRSEFQIIDPLEILFLQADNNTTDIYMITGEKLTAFKTLKSFENRLPDNFLRIHQSYIINTTLIRRINFRNSEVVIKFQKNTQRIPFSRSYKSTVKSLQTELVNR